jgi:hypothetical protein
LVNQLYFKDTEQSLSPSTGTATFQNASVGRRLKKNKKYDRLESAFGIIALFFKPENKIRF